MVFLLRHQFVDASLQNLFGYNGNNILICYRMPQAHALWHMSGTGTPYQGIFKCILEGTVNLVTHVLNRGVLTHDKRLVEIRLCSLSVYRLSVRLSHYQESYPK